MSDHATSRRLLGRGITPPVRGVAGDGHGAQRQLQQVQLALQELFAQISPRDRQGSVSAWVGGDAGEKLAATAYERLTELAGSAQLLSAKPEKGAQHKAGLSADVVQLVAAAYERVTIRPGVKPLSWAEDFKKPPAGQPIPVFGGGVIDRAYSRFGDGPMAAERGVTVSLPSGPVALDFGSLRLSAAEVAAIRAFDWAGAGGGNGVQFIAALREGLGDELTDKLSGIRVIKGGQPSGGLFAELFSRHSRGNSPHGRLGLDGAAIGADVNAVVDARPGVTGSGDHGLVDGTVDGQSSAKVSADAHAEAVYDLGAALLDLTEGRVPTHWGTQEYIGFVFGVAGHGDLVGSRAWAQFIKDNGGAAGLRGDPQELDYSAFAPYFQDGETDGDSVLADLVGQGQTLHDVFKAMQAGSARSYTEQTFQQAYNKLDIPAERHLGVGVSNPYAEGDALRTGLAGGGASAEGGAASGLEEAAILGTAASVAIAAGVGSGLTYLDDENFNDFVNLERDTDKVDIAFADVAPRSETHRHRGEAVYLAEAVVLALDDGGANSAADLLLQAEADGAQEPVIKEVLTSLAPAARTELFQALRARIGGTDYFKALQNGQKYSYLTDLAFDAGPSSKSLLDGLLALKTPPVSATITPLAIELFTNAPNHFVSIAAQLFDRGTPVGVGTAAALVEALPVAKRLHALAFWGGAEDVGTLSDALAAGHPDVLKLLAAMSDKGEAETRAAIQGYAVYLDNVNDFPADAEPGEQAKFLQGLSAPSKAAKTYAQAFLLNQLSADDADAVLAALPDSVESMIRAVLANAVDQETASNQSSEFLALDTPKERAEYIKNLPPDSLDGSNGSSSKGVQLLLLVSDAEAAKIVVLLGTDATSNTLDALYTANSDRGARIIVQLFEAPGVSVTYGDPGDHLLKLFQKSGPEESARIVAKLDDTLAVLKGKNPNALDTLLASPLWEAVENYTAKLGSEEANFVASLSTDEAADYLLSLDPKAAAAILDQLVKSGQAGRAAEIADAISRGATDRSPKAAAAIIEKMSAQGAARVLSEMTQSRAVEVAALLTDKRLAEILFEMESEDVPDFYTHVIDAYNSAGRTVTKPEVDADAGLLTVEQKAQVTNETVLELPDGTEVATGTVEIKGEAVPVVDVTGSQGGFLVEGQRAVVPVDVDGKQQFRFLDEKGNVLQGVAAIPPSEYGGGWYAMTLPALSRVGRTAIRAAGRFRDIGSPVFGPGRSFIGSPTGSTSSNSAYHNFAVSGSNPINFPANAASYMTSTSPSATLNGLKTLLAKDPATLTQTEAIRVVRLTDSLLGKPEQQSLTQEQKIAILRIVDSKNISYDVLSDDFWAVVGTTSVTSRTVWPPEIGDRIIPAIDTTIDAALAKFGAELKTWDRLTLNEREDLTARIYIFLKGKFGLSFLPATPNFRDDGTAGGFTGAPNGSSELLISPRYLQETNGSGVMATLVHEMHHALQYSLIRRLNGEGQPLLPSDSYYDWTLLLNASNNHFHSEDGIGPNHPDYTAIWEETSAFRAGDEAMSRVAQYLDQPLYVEYKVPGGNTVIYRAAPGNLADDTYVPDSYRGGSGISSFWLDQYALISQFEANISGFIGITAEQYGDRAIGLFEAKLGSTVLETQNGSETIRFNTETNEFAIRGGDGAIKTYFIADPKVHGWETNLEFFENFGRNK